MKDNLILYIGKFRVQVTLVTVNLDYLFTVNFTNVS